MNTLSPADMISTEDIDSCLLHMAGDDAHLIGDWTVEQFKGGRGESLGVWRVSGMMAKPDREQPWSLVLKGWDRTDQRGSPASFNWSWREAELYRSGLLENLPGVAAPASHGITEREGAIWVWLDDLTGVPQPEWTVERYAMAARRLGQFNGAYLGGRPIPNHPSLSQRWLKQWTIAAEDTMATLDDHVQHPFVREMLPPDVQAAFVRIWNRRQASLDIVHSLPQTFCHLDAFHQSIFFRDQDGDEELLLIDWSFSGTGAVGEDLTALCMASAAHDRETLGNLNEVERVAFAAYIEGLQDVGWTGDEDLLWRAYRAAMLLRFGPAMLRPLLRAVMDEDIRRALSAAMSIPFEEMQPHLTHYCQWIAERADEA